MTFQIVLNGGVVLTRHGVSLAYALWQARRAFGNNLRSVCAVSPHRIAA